jgi:YidC/Oxa1 family membrane protein insertase
VGALQDLWGFIVAPLYFVISAVLVGWHNVWGRVFGDESGASWVMSIIGLTLVIRAALIPLFVKQIKSSRNMQLLQPKLKELRDKYGHDRERFAQEQMKLFKETGTNPLASCLPLILQMPIFLALFRMLDRAAHQETRGVLTLDQVKSLSQAKIFGARIADTFTGAEGDSAVAVRVLAGILVLAMTATTFLTQRQLMTKNMPADAMKGQYAQQQKMLLYILPIVFAVGGIAFPIGVIIYWTTSNLWTMGQQFYVIRNNPAPGTPAFAAKAKRDAAKQKRKGGGDDGADGDSGNGATPGPTAPAAPTATAVRRQQPKKQSREQRKKGKGAPPRSPGGSAGG